MGLGTATIVFVPKNIRSGCRILVLEGCLENSAVNASGVYIAVDARSFLKHLKKKKRGERIFSSRKPGKAHGAGWGARATENDE